MSPQPVLGMFLSAAFRYILSLFTLCLSQKRPASPSPRASGPMGETPPRTDPPKSALQVARPRALSPGLSALPAVHPLPSGAASGPATVPPANPRQPLRSPHRHADLCPQSTPPRPKSFLEKTLTRANPPHSAPQSTHPATLLTATTSLANGPVTKLLALLLLAAVLTACDATPTQELHVFAAASLREAITEAADAFQQPIPMSGSSATSPAPRSSVSRSNPAPAPTSSSPPTPTTWTPCSAPAPTRAPHRRRHQRTRPRRPRSATPPA